MRQQDPIKNRDLVNMSIKVYGSQKNDLKAMGEREDRSVSSIVRRAIDKEIERFRRRKAGKP